MQKRTREQSVTRMRWYAVLLLALTAVGMIGCQQPTKTPVKEVKQEKQEKQEKAQKPSGETPSKPEKKKNGKESAEKTTEKEPEKQQQEGASQNQAGQIT